jgi:DNA-binding beta-propeller fold protein YncE
MPIEITWEAVMFISVRQRCVLAMSVVALIFGAVQGHAQSMASSVPGNANLLSNPYQPAIEHWGELGRKWGDPAGLNFDSKGHLWVFERCGGPTCAGSSLAPINEFDMNGKLLKSFGAEMFVFPHALYIDKQDNIWVTDATAKDGKGNVVVKFSPEGKVLMTLGKPGESGTGTDVFNRPSGVVIAPNGDIFVADGHGGDSNARILKFTKDGKFIKTWGKKGSGPGEFDTPHSITMDSKGRLFVADRENARVQIFDQDGSFIAQWLQFSRPSDVAIDKNDMLFVPDNSSNGDRLAMWPRGIRIGSVKDGIVTGFIPDPDQDPKSNGNGPEGLASDGKGTLFGSDRARQQVKKFVVKK